MPYNSRKSHYRRRRYNKNLTTRNIFSRTKAKQQAKQIYSLRKRVSAISRVLRPEIKTAITKYDGFDLDSVAYSSSYVGYCTPLPTYGDQEAQRTGDIITVKNLTWYLSMEYYNSSDTGYHSTESAGTQIRIIVIQSKDPTTSTIPDLNSILRQSGATGTDYTLRSVSPFIRGFSEIYRVLYDKGFYITSTKNQLALTIHTKPANYRWDTDEHSNNVFLYIIPSGLHADANFTEHIHGAIMAKLAYTDA